MYTNVTIIIIIIIIVVIIIISVQHHVFVVKQYFVCGVRIVLVDFVDCWLVMC